MTPGQTSIPFGGRDGRGSSSSTSSGSRHLERRVYIEPRRHPRIEAKHAAQQIMACLGTIANWIIKSLFRELPWRTSLQRSQATR